MTTKHGEKAEEETRTKAKPRARKSAKAAAESETKTQTKAEEREEVDAKADGRRVMTKGEALLELSEMARCEGNATARLGALKELARIEGWGVQECAEGMVRVVTLETPRLGKDEG